MTNEPCEHSDPAMSAVKERARFAVPFLELTAECSPAAIQLQAASLLGCEQLGPLCTSSDRLGLWLSEMVSDFILCF